MSDQSLDHELALMQRRVRVARGEEPGDLLLAGGGVVNVFTSAVERADVVVADGAIAGVGPYDWTARDTISCAGQFLLPGFIDGHMHLESTLLTPAEFARVVVPQGTAAVVADPHEVGNVLGLRGIERLLAASEGLPLDIYFMAPSCVPCSPWEHAGATLDADAVGRLLAHDRILGLAEVMDFPGVLGGNPSVLSKVITARALHGAVDGHAPGLQGRDLVAYAAAGIRSDHESTAAVEAAAKAALGMMVQVREGSAARNLNALLPLMVADRLGDWCLATDDIYPADLMREGHINGLVRRCVAAGVPPARAVRHASLVPARHYELRDRGAIAPGFRANVVVTDDLVQFAPRLVLHEGAIVARDGKYLVDALPPVLSPENTVHLSQLDESAFVLPLASDRATVIRVIPDQIGTRREVQNVCRENGRWKFAPAADVALTASIERHRATGQIGLGLAAGFGLKRRGAIASSVAHDSHNLVLVGTDARDMLACVRAIEALHGGWVVSIDGQVVAELPLPHFGLLSAADASTACAQLDAVNEAARRLGCTLNNPFGALSFLALSVIPEARITDQGVFDVVTQQFLRL